MHVCTVVMVCIDDFVLGTGLKHIAPAVNMILLP